MAEPWERTNRPLATAAGDGGDFNRASVGLLLAHEDETCPGALIASPPMP